MYNVFTSSVVGLRLLPPPFLFIAKKRDGAVQMRGLMSRFSFKQSKNFVFPTSCVLTSQNTDVRKLSNKRHADGVPFARFARFLLPHFAFGKTGRTGAPQSAA